MVSQVRSGRPANERIGRPRHEATGRRISDHEVRTEHLFSEGNEFAVQGNIEVALGGMPVQLTALRRPWRIGSHSPFYMNPNRLYCENMNCRHVSCICGSCGTLYPPCKHSCCQIRNRRTISNRLVITVLCLNAGVEAFTSVNDIASEEPSVN